MIKRIAFVMSAAVAGLVMAVPAQAATITCSVRVSRVAEVFSAWSIVSNHPDPHRVHAFRTNFRGKVITYSPELAAIRPMPIPSTYVEGWQAGTKCKTWYNPKGVG